MLDFPDTSDVFGSFSLSTSPNSPTSPLLPRETQDAAMTSKSTTSPEKPIIVEGNRLSHFADPLKNIKVLVDVRNSVLCTKDSTFNFHWTVIANRGFLFKICNKT